MKVAVRFSILITLVYSVCGQICVSENDRVDCYPFEGATETTCLQKGCLWCPAVNEGAPSCHLPPWEYGYIMNGPMTEFPGGNRINLRRATNITYVGGDADEISVFFYFDSNERIRIKITDNTDRFEVPLPINPPANPSTDNPLYRIEYFNEPVFSFKVIRVSTGTAIFDTSLGGLTFADQFIQIVNKVPSTNGYGIGENEQTEYRHDFSRWQVFGVYTRDDTPVGNQNVYGAHPTYTMVENDGSTHTVLFLNSNAQEFILTPAPSYTYRTIGGLLDIYIFLGPTPEQAVAQYHQAIGRQPIPAYWSLGFNLCRWSYNSLENMRATIDRTAAAGIPQDVQFGDLDIMYDWLTFTYDENNTYNSYSGLPEFIRELKSKGIHFIQSVNAQISSEARRLPDYLPLRLGNEMDVWVRRPDGSTSTGVLWPGGNGEGWTKPAGPGYGGNVYFADFSRPSTIDWWYTLCNEYRQNLEWDGLWLDMNEPASWVDGDVEGCANTLINRPPYSPHGVKNNISDLTICPDHVQDYGTLYNTHSLYGWSEARGSFEAIQRIFGTNRTFQLSRSTYPGSGQWAAHWLGDNFSTWGNLASSQIGIMGFNLFGIPQSGVDICGFYGRPSEELCTRWLQVGAFYPYSRNHNVRSTSDNDQDPASWSEASRNSTRDALMIRYTILPYMYHLFYVHRANGGTVMRALWHEFPTDQTALGVDTQFLVGPAFLVSPVLIEGRTSIDAYFPRGRWYAYRTGEEVVSTGSVTLNAPSNFINLHVRGGYILPTQEPAMNTMLSRQNPFGLIVALDENFSAKGEMYYDDGITYEVQEEGSYFLSTITYSDNTLTQTVIRNGYQDISQLNLKTVRLFGAPGEISTILVNGAPHTDFEMILPGNELQINNLNIPINSNYTIQISFSQLSCLPESNRIDCYPFEGATETICLERGCLWCPAVNEGAPSCHLPPDYGYIMDGPMTEFPGGFRINLRRATNITYVGADADAISVFFYFDSNERIRIKITDNTDRFEVPLPINPPANPSTDNPLYRIEYFNEPVFSFKVIRVSTGTAIFDTSLGGLTFADQFIQIVNKVPSTNGYGIGENEQTEYRHDFSRWQVFGVYTRDDTPVGNQNVYGAHPTYTMVENDGNTHTVLFLNSNAQEFILTPAPSYTYRTIGGLLDIYIFLGPTPEQAVAQYHQAIGRQPIPAYWSIGFNLCRWSYNSLENMRATIDRTAAAGIPQDVQFGDLDIMYDWLTFTYDENNTYNSYSGLPEFIRELKSKGIHFIQSVNAQISSEARRLPDYLPLRLGNEMDVWVKRPDGSTSTGVLWPGGNGEGWTKPAGPGYGGNVYFADFSRPSTIDWWYTLCNEYRQNLEWDGLWLDMNEPASWVDGDVEGCANTLINRPPYSPHGIKNNISDLTICPDHVQDYGTLYNTHSLYGWSEARGSFEAIQRIFGTNRTFQLSRSTYPGSGQWAAHWLGDNFSTWGNLASSQIGIMGFNLFGIPQSGVDICGFYGRPSEELCTRWLQVGAFYPYSRNHNVRSTSDNDQDPASWSEASRNSTRDALMIRYTILPYMYHLFYIHRANGGTVMRALWHEFPTDQTALAVDTQFLVGPAFLVSPVLIEGRTSVDAYFPSGRWYAYRTGQEITSTGRVNLNAPSNFINLHVRGGYILPTQEPAMNTMLSRQNPFGLIVALDENFTAKGEMYYDDGITYEVQEDGVYFLSTITYSEGRLTQTVVRNGYQDISQLNLKTIRLFGAPSGINTILVNGAPHTDFEKILPGNELQIHNLNIPVNSQYTINFSMEVTEAPTETTPQPTEPTEPTTQPTEPTEPSDSGSVQLRVACGWILFVIPLVYNLFNF